MNSYSSDRCITYSNTCPSTAVGSCNHTEDVTVECSKLYTVNRFFSLVFNFYKAFTNLLICNVHKHLIHVYIIWWIISFVKLTSA